MNQGAKPIPSVVRRGLPPWAWAALLALLVAALTHALLREVVRRAVPWLGGMAGYEIRTGSVMAGFFQPVVLRDVEISDVNGTKLEVSEAT